LTPCSGQDIRDFVYIDDVAQMLSLLFQSEAMGVFNVGSGVGYKVKTISEKLGAIVGRSEFLRFQDSGEVPSVVVADMRKFSREFGGYPRTPIDEALEMSVHERKLSSTLGYVPNESKQMSKATSYDEGIPDAEEFKMIRDGWRRSLGEDTKLREQALQLVVRSNEYSYGHQWEWCGVPIVRHPDDIVLQQEIMWELKPSCVIETGVARGGSMALSASLMSLTHNTPRVLGLDIQVLRHTSEALSPWVKSGQIELLECDSTSTEAITGVKNFLGKSNGPALLILDSNHSHEHVLAELTALGLLMPLGSVIIVADTIVEEMPKGYYPSRPWGKGDNPLTAVNEYLQRTPQFKLNEKWSRRSLMGECRDGVIVRVSE
jgi:cephalosporin hydroxylase